MCSCLGAPEIDGLFAVVGSTERVCALHVEEWESEFICGA